MAQDWAGVEAGRLLTTLEQLLALEATELRTTLTRASQLLAKVLDADKVDVLLYEAESDSLVALGTSDTPMGRNQHALGLDRLPLADGGQTVEAYQTGRSYLMARVADARGELKLITEDLGVKSSIGAPLLVDGERRGVVLAASGQPERFTESDLRFLEVVSRWVGMVTSRAELVKQLAERAVAEGYERGVEESVSVLTKRQQEVAGLVGRGYTNARIAQELVIVEGTAANHIESILMRLGLENRTQVAVWAVQQGLHRPDGGANPAED